MSITYTYTRESVNGRFNINNPNRTKTLFDELKEIFLDNPPTKVRCDGTDVFITFENPVDETLLATSVAEHKSTTINLEDYKIKQAEVISELVKDFIYLHYEPKRQATLTAMMTLAIAQGLTHRLQYISQVWAWASTVMEYYYSIEDAINTASTKVEVDAIVNTPLNFSDFEVGSGVVGKEDPVITIRQAMSITD
jgi:hypothetical protein